MTFLAFFSAGENRGGGEWVYGLNFAQVLFCVGLPTFQNGHYSCRHKLENNTFVCRLRKCFSLISRKEFYS